MIRIVEALVTAAILLAIAVLAMFDVIPQSISQYAPLIAVPWIIRSNPHCKAGREQQA